MLVVMTLIGLLAAVAAPSVGSGVETVRLRSTGERLAATMRPGRDRAMRAHRFMEASVDPKSGLVELRDLEAGSMTAWELPPSILIKRDKRIACLVHAGVGGHA